MAENERPTGLAIINAIRAQQQSRGLTDRTNLEDTLCKSALWKKNTLQQIANDPHASDTDSADPEERRQADTLRRRDDEIDRLQQIVAHLEAENARLDALRQTEFDARKTEALDFQQAFDQFQQESDALINELDEENQRLRTACKLNNPRSLL